MPDELMIIVCRSVADYDLCSHTILASHIITNCALCKIAVAVGLAGQKAMNTSCKIYILCSSCTKRLAQSPNKLEVTDIILSQEIIEQINRNLLVAKNVEELQKNFPLKKEK